MSTKLAFLDTETTGLDPDVHEVWDVGLILRDSEGVEVEYEWQLPVDLGRADAMALKIGRWYDRRLPWPVYEAGRTDADKATDAVRISTAVEGQGTFVVPPERMHEWAALFAELTDGAHLVGAVISFDEERLRRLLRRLGACPTWHYHLIDVEALAAGLSGSTPPWDSEALSRKLDVEPDQFDRHTALGDARWARAVYEAVLGRAGEGGR